MFVLLIPLLGSLGHLLLRGDTVQQLSAAAEDSGSTSSQLPTLAGLRDRGVLAEDEFAQPKAKILA